MSTSADFTGLGIAPAVASRLGNDVAAVAGTGTTQAGATKMGTPVTLGTPAGGATAFVLSGQASKGRPFYFFNASTSVAAVVFPPVGGNINNGSANASVSIAANKSAIFVLTGVPGGPAQTWGAILSA